MANGQGGKRPGAGRKKTATAEHQATMRDVFQAAVTEEEWLKIITRAKQGALAGDPVDRAWLAPWIVGKVPDTSEVTHKGGVSIYMPEIKSE